MSELLGELLKDWHDELAVLDIYDAEKIIHLLEIELAGKNAVIAALHDDLGYYRKERKDEMIQDQGVSKPKDTTEGGG